MSVKTPLWVATRDLHHACEEHEVGGAMSTGSPPYLWYAKWLMALKQIHTVVDSTLPECVHRVSRIEEDLASMAAAGYIVSELAYPEIYANEIAGDSLATAGAAYVLTGAHLMGGEVMRRRLVGYPTKHLEWGDRKEALAVLSELRMREDINEQAKNCFRALLTTMDEIRDDGII